MVNDDDIELASNPTWNSALKWPLGTDKQGTACTLFMRSFNRNSHTITGLRFAGQADTNIHLWGIGAPIKNVV